MKLVDPSGKEVTSKENKDAKELEQQLNKQIEKLLEPIFNKIQMSGAQVPQEQLIQLSSAAHQMLFNRMIYNLLRKVGIKEIAEVLSEDDVEELQTSLSNQLQIVNPSEAQNQGQNPDQNS
jgi:translation initiation factor 2 alpha subunit (eIF-2alpha)